MRSLKVRMSEPWSSETNLVSLEANFHAEDDGDTFVAANPAPYILRTFSVLLPVHDSSCKWTSCFFVSAKSVEYSRYPRMKIRTEFMGNGRELMELGEIFVSHLSTLMYWVAWTLTDWSGQTVRSLRTTKSMRMRKTLKSNGSNLEKLDHATRHFTQSWSELCGKLDFITRSW